MPPRKRATKTATFVVEVDVRPDLRPAATRAYQTGVVRAAIARHLVLQPGNLTPWMRVAKAALGDGIKDLYHTVPYSNIQTIISKNKVGHPPFRHLND
jgi:hypothetical protein